MNINVFVNQNSLKPADVIVVKKAAGILDHYVVYLGYDSYQGHCFIVNMSRQNIKLIPETEASVFLKKYQPVGISRFSGKEWERNRAVERAFTYPDKQYHLIVNNCEHFANFVQRGVKESKQADAAIGIGLAAVVVGAVFGLMNEE